MSHFYYLRAVLVGGLENFLKKRETESRVDTPISNFLTHGIICCASLVVSLYFKRELVEILNYVFNRESSPQDLELTSYPRGVLELGVSSVYVLIGLVNYFLVEPEHLGHSHDLILSSENYLNVFSSGLIAYVIFVEDCLSVSGMAPLGVDLLTRVAVASISAFYLYLGGNRLIRLLKNERGGLHFNLLAGLNTLKVYLFFISMIEVRGAVEFTLRLEYYKMLEESLELLGSAYLLYRHLRETESSEIKFGRELITPTLTQLFFHMSEHVVPLILVDDLFVYCLTQLIELVVLEEQQRRSSNSQEITINKSFFDVCLQRDESSPSMVSIA